MVRPLRDRFDELHVAGRADFEMHATTTEMFYEKRVFEAPNAVADPLGSEQLERFPDAVRSASLARVGRRSNPMVVRITIRGDVRGDGVPRLVAREVEGSHPTVAEFLYEANGFEALRLGAVSECTENDSCLDSRSRDHCVDRSVNNGYDLVH
jgi:hypothetical protein